MSLSQYQSIVQGFASGNSQRSESAGERFSSAKEGYLQKAGITRDLEERKEQNRYSSAIEGVESAYDATLKVYGDKVKKYQSEVLQQLGISEEDQAKGQAIIGVAGTIAPLAAQVGKFGLKSLTKSAGAKDLAKGAKTTAKTLKEKVVKSGTKRDLSKPLDQVEDTEFTGDKISSQPAVSSEDIANLSDKRLRKKVMKSRQQAEPDEKVEQSVDEPVEVKPGEAGPSNAKAPTDIEMQNMRGKFSKEMQDMTKKKFTDKQDAKIQEVEDENLKELEDYKAEGGEVTTDDLEKAGLTGEDIAETGADAGTDVAKIAGQGAAEIEEATEAAASSLLADAGDIAIGAASFASDALGPLGAVVGLGLSVYEIGNAFHWWGGGSDSGDKPTPPPKAPTPPDLKSIPKPRDILVKAVAPTKSISAHYGLLAAPSTNSNIMRR